jgi:hypothetical protein
LDSTVSAFEMTPVLCFSNTSFNVVETIKEIGK